MSGIALGVAKAVMHKGVPFLMTFIFQLGKKLQINAQGLKS